MDPRTKGHPRSPGSYSTRSVGQHKTYDVIRVIITCDCTGRHIFFLKLWPPIEREGDIGVKQFLRHKFFAIIGMPYNHLSSRNGNYKIVRQGFDYEKGLSFLKRLFPKRNPRGRMVSH